MEKPPRARWSKHYTKEQILESYLNQINLGRGWYGVEAGARHYFGRQHASQLTLAEAATLGGPSRNRSRSGIRSPIPRPRKQRRNLILQKMAEQGYITPELAEKTKAEPMVTAPNGGMSAASGYFVDAVRQQAERAGIQIMNGGYQGLHDARSCASAAGGHRASSTGPTASRRRRAITI